MGVVWVAGAAMSLGAPRISIDYPPWNQQQFCPWKESPIPKRKRSRKPHCLPVASFLRGYTYVGFGGWVHPRKLTWNLKIGPWKRRFLLETTIFRCYVSFRGIFYPNGPNLQGYGAMLVFRGSIYFGLPSKLYIYMIYAIHQGLWGVSNHNSYPHYAAMTQTNTWKPFLESYEE